jgi:hypothetical protein
VGVAESFVQAVRPPPRHVLRSLGTVRPVLADGGSRRLEGRRRLQTRQGDTKSVQADRFRRL